MVIKHPFVYRPPCPGPALLGTKELENTASVSEEHTCVWHTMTQSSGFYELRIGILHSGLTLILWHACMCVRACVDLTAAILSGARSL